MKVAKIKIIKNRSQNGTNTKFSYPDEYDKSKISPFIYQNGGEVIEYCLALVSDDYEFSDDITEVSSSDAETLVEDWVDDDKDLDHTDTDHISDIKTLKKSHIPS